MHQILLLESQPLLLKNHLRSQSLTVPELSFSNNGVSSITSPWKIKTTKSHLCRRSSVSSNFNLPSNFPQRVKKIFGAKKNRRQPGWRRSGKAAIECALFIASNLKVLPEPINLIIREGFGSGNGGGFGSWNGFGGGGGGGGGFEGWGGRKRNLGFLKFLLGGCVLILLLVFRKEFEGLGDLGIGALGLFLLGVIERDWKRGARGWIFGFCSCALMVFLGLRREEMQKWVQGFRVRSPIMDLFRRKRRWRRRAM